jgi:hypothetical protein
MEIHTYLLTDTYTHDKIRALNKWKMKVKVNKQKQKHVEMYENCQHYTEDSEGIRFHVAVGDDVMNCSILASSSSWKRSRSSREVITILLPR